MENSNYRNDRKYLNNMQKDQFLKVKNSLLESEKDFVELEHRELKYREIKIKRDRRVIFQTKHCVYR